MGAFTALPVCARLPVRRLVLNNAMIPAPGETAGDWWEHTGSEAARLAAARRSSAHAAALGQLADELGNAADDAAAQALDLAFFHTVIEAAGNLVFTLILNSIRSVYLAHLERFRAVVEERAELVPLYRRVARAIAAGSERAAADATRQLAAAQEERMVATLGRRR
jgi:DNA-binding FadR family transcriptional regulator